MSRVKQQLKSFYRGKGLKGKRLKRAVWADVGRVKANAEFAFSPTSYIEGIFCFCDSPEGSRYWALRTFPLAMRRWL